MSYIAELLFGVDVDPTGLRQFSTDATEIFQGLGHGVTGVFEGLGHSGMIGLSELTRGVSKVAEAGHVGAFAMREFTGAAFRLGEFLGPMGPLIPVIGLLGYAFYEAFDKAGKEAEKAREKMAQELAGAMDDFDQIALRKQLRELEIGKPSAGVGEGGGYAGSIRDLVAQVNATAAEYQRLQTLIDDGTGKPVYEEDTWIGRATKVQMDALTRHYNDLEKELKPLRDQQARLRDALINPQLMPGMTSPLTGLPKLTIDVDSPAKALAKAQKEFTNEVHRSASEASGLATVFNMVLKAHQSTAEAALSLQRVYGDLRTELGKLTDPLGSQLDLWISIKRAMEDIEKTDYFKMLRQKIPGFNFEVIPGLPRQGGPAVPYAPDAPAADVGELSLFTKIRTGFEDLLGTLGSTLTSTLSAAFGPVALLMKVMEPALRILDTLFDKLLAPLTAVVEVIAAGLEPVFRLLFPIVRDVAIAMTYLQEIMDRVVAAIARLVGNVITAIGALIAHIPFLGGLGHSIENLGKSILNYADGVSKSANEMAQVRKRLEAMQFGQTADDIAQLGDAAAAAAEQLNNVPSGFKAALDFLTYAATDARHVGYTGHSGALADGGGGTVVIEKLYVDARQASASELVQVIKREVQTQARSLSGDVAKASDVWNH